MSDSQTTTEAPPPNVLAACDRTIEAIDRMCNALHFSTPVRRGGEIHRELAECRNLLFEAAAWLADQWQTPPRSPEL